MDDALAIRDCLPISFKNQNDADYIAFLWETFEGNYESGKYQFAMLACHMLYMSFVYFSVRQIKLSRPADFANEVIFQQKGKELLTALRTSRRCLRNSDLITHSMRIELLCRRCGFLQ